MASFDPTGFPHQNAGEVQDFRPTDYVRRIDPYQWGRSSLVAASALAWPPTTPVSTSSRSLRVVPTAWWADQRRVSGCRALTAQMVDGGFAAQDPALLGQLPANRLANAVSEELGLTGESLTLATACSASNYAIGYGYDLLVSGEADVVIAGGADSVCRWAHAGFFRLGALTGTACAPL
nr:beta-ketoacyl synthase N-terminal-like domain-containing protein [Salinispora arenicola]